MDNKSKVQDFDLNINAKEFYPKFYANKNDEEFNYRKTETKNRIKPFYLINEPLHTIKKNIASWRDPNISKIPIKLNPNADEFHPKTDGFYPDMFGGKKSVYINFIFK
jgi:hypothetical protein